MKKIEYKVTITMPKCDSLGDGERHLQELIQSDFNIDDEGRWKVEVTKIGGTTMREETLINAVNDIDDIRCKLEDIHQDIMDQPDYWEKLKHQYAGMAMQASIAHYGVEVPFKDLADDAIGYATALVNKLKEEEKCEK